MENHKTPHPPKRMNILGRMRYSSDANVADVIDFSFDDCWKSITCLWVVVAMLVFNALKEKRKSAV